MVNSLFDITGKKAIDVYKRQTFHFSLALLIFC